MILFIPVSRRNAHGLLFERAVSQFGLITAADAREEGIDPVRLRQMLQRGTLERMSRGVYRFPAAPASRLDDYAAAVFWPIGVRGVLSHETALDLHELCDVNPAGIDITVPSAHRVRGREIPPAYRFHRRDLDPEDLMALDGLPIVTPVRAVLDGVDLALRQDLIEQAIDTLRERSALDRGGERRIYRRIYA